MVCNWTMEIHKKAMGVDCTHLMQSTTRLREGRQKIYCEENTIIMVHSVPDSLRFAVHCRQMEYGPTFVVSLHRPTNAEQVQKVQLL